MTLADRLAKLIEDKGVTPYKIAEQTGLRQSVLSKILSGKTTKPQESTLSLLSKYFLVSYEWLRTGAGEKVNVYEGGDEKQVSSSVDNLATIKDLITNNTSLARSLEIIAESNRELVRSNALLVAQLNRTLKGDAHMGAEAADAG